MTTDSSETERLLAEILIAVQQLNQTLQMQKRRSEDLECVEKLNEGLGAPDPENWHPSSSSEPKDVQREENDSFQHSILPYPKSIYINECSSDRFGKSKGQRRIWTEYIGDAWTLPPDNSIDLGFQEHLLEKLSGYDLKSRLEGLQIFNNNLLDSQTPLDSKPPKRRNWFRHFTIEDTLPYARFEAHTYTIGQMKSRSFLKPSQYAFSDISKQLASLCVPHGEELTGANSESHMYVKAPWQRLIRQTSRLSNGAASRHRYEHWTILQLTPEGFGKPEKAVGNMDLAVLSLVTTSLEKVTNRWSELMEFLRALLEGGNSLLDPVRHDHLLFDNEDFSRSREYFWAINCLAEFEASISANIEQWEEFRRYLKPLETPDQRGPNLSSVSGEGLLRDLLERSDTYCARLRRYQRFFQDKRAATVALRDGVRKVFPFA
ncbi:MAG: hypothetical protein Q9217_004905 [Psora testacea]